MLEKDLYVCIYIYVYIILGHKIAQWVNSVHRCWGSTPFYSGKESLSRNPHDSGDSLILLSSRDSYLVRQASGEFLKSSLTHNGESFLKIFIICICIWLFTQMSTELHKHKPFWVLRSFLVQYVRLILTEF